MGVVDVDELASFVRIPAPTGDEQARLAWLEQRLAGLPGTRRRDGAGNLIWGGSEATPALLVMAHVDTVFDESTPLVVKREDEQLVGPGVGDNAAAVMALIWVLERLPAFPPGLVVAFTVGEEGLGNLRGARRACEELRPKLALAVEGHGLEIVITEHVGSVRARITVTGPGGHSWRDRGTPSAIHALVEIAGGLAGAGANIGTISGGRSVNAIADRAEMVVERRSLEDAELERFAAGLGELAVQPPLSLACELVGRRPAGLTDAAHPLVRTILDVRRELGLPARYDSGSTDANAAIANGIPAVAIGCARGAGMHTTGERIDLGSLELGCRQLDAIIRALVG